MKRSAESSSTLRPERPLALASYLRAVRHSPAGLQGALARKLFPYLFRRVATSKVEICEFDSLENYELNYRHLAASLDHREKVLPPGEIEFLFSIQNRGVHPGTISLREFLFLTAFTSILAPQRAIEVGTLAGFSAAIIAAAIHRRQPDQRGVLVTTIDRNTHSVIEPDKPVGFQIPDIIPDLPDAVRVHSPANSSAIREFAKRDELQLVFIDADHQHPRPLLDLLRATPCVGTGGWILLHDIKLGTIGLKPGQAVQRVGPTATYGAEWLFDYWPFRKIAGGNIGAVQLPPRKSDIIPTALRLMTLPFEMSATSHARIRRALYACLAELP